MLGYNPCASIHDRIEISIRISPLDVFNVIYPRFFAFELATPLPACWTRISAQVYLEIDDYHMHAKTVLEIAGGTATNVSHIPTGEYIV